MSLTAQEAFKVGFLARFVEEGLNADQMLDRIIQAAAVVEKHAGIIGDIGGLATNVGKGIGDFALGYGAPALIAAPPILGGMAGYGLARATDIDDCDIDEIKNRELVDEYHRQSQKLKRQKAVRDYSKAKQQTGRIFM